MKQINDASFNRIINDYGNQVLKICYFYVKDYYIAQDLTQETFICVYEKYGSLRDKAYEKNWIVKIAVNKCKNYLKTVKNTPLFLDDQHHIPSSDQYENILNTNVITYQIMQLPEKYKEVVILYYYEQFQIKEIAQILNEKENTILQRLKRAREKLKPLLEEVL